MSTVGSASVMEKGELRRERSRTVIRAVTGWPSLALWELWSYRELLLYLVWRDIKVRYKQTFFGTAWVVLQPLATMMVFVVLFGRLAGFESRTGGLPYALFVLAGLLPWQLFASGLNQAALSVVTDQTLVTKIYFPRVLIPLASVLGALLDCAIALVLLVALMFWYRTAPTLAMLALPLVVVLATAAALGVALWLSALNVRFRDVRYVLPFLTQLWLFATPIAYPLQLVPPAWRTFYGINPLVGIVEAFRWALLGGPPVPGAVACASLAGTLVLLLSGALFFRRMERRFADTI